MKTKLQSRDKALRRVLDEFFAVKLAYEVLPKSDSAEIEEYEVYTVTIDSIKAIMETE